MSPNLRSLPRIGRWPRLIAAAACLLLAAVSALGATSRERAAADTGRTVRVVVAAHVLAAGHVLRRGDLVVARWPASVRPAAAAADPHRFIGQRVAGPLAAHEPVTTRRLVGSDLASGLGAGRVALPVTIDDPHAVDLVRPGDRVDVLATPRPSDVGAPAQAAEAKVLTIAAAVVVLAVLPGTEDTTTELVIGADRSTALAITRHRTTQMFTVVVVPP